MHALKPHLDGKAHVIWDWNGTLLDDVALCVDVIQSVARRHGVPPLDHERYLQLFRFPVIEYYRDAGFDLERVSFADLTHEFMSAYLPRARTAPLFDGATELLQDLADLGIRSYVLSATKEPDLVEMLRHFRIDGHFTHIFGIGDRFASSKVARGHDLVARIGAPLEEIVLIGDTDHDLEVGQALGIDVILVEGGHQHAERLAARHHRVVRRRVKS